MEGLFTTILHDKRKELNLTILEYCFLDSVYHLSRKKGYCYKSKKSFAELLSISEKSVYNMMDKLEQRGFIYRDEQKHIYIKEIFCSIYEKITDMKKLQHNTAKFTVDTLQNLQSDTAKIADNNNIILDTNNNRIKKEEKPQNYLDVNYLLTLFSDEEINYYTKDLLIDWLEYNIIDHKKKERALKMQINKLKSDFNNFDKFEIREKIRYAITSNHISYYTDKLKNIGKERLELEEYKRQHDADLVKDFRTLEEIEQKEKEERKNSFFLNEIGAV